MLPGCRAADVRCAAALLSAHNQASPAQHSKAVLPQHLICSAKAVSSVHRCSMSSQRYSHALVVRAGKTASGQIACMHSATAAETGTDAQAQGRGGALTIAASEVLLRHAYMQG